MGAHTVNGLKCKSIGFPGGHLTDVNGSRVNTSLITGFWAHVVYKNPRTSVLFSGRHFHKDRILRRTRLVHQNKPIWIWSRSKDW